MSAQSWARTTLGVLAIGAILAGLWVEWGPRWASDEEFHPAHARLADAHAVVSVREGADRRRASIACDGDLRRASGFWARDAVAACDALAAARAALLAGPGCRRLDSGQVGVVVRGAFGTRRFTHRMVRGGCPDPDEWLAVNALADPVIGPDQELDQPRAR